MKRTAKEWSTDLQHARSLAVKCAEERDVALRKIEGMESACKGYADTVLRIKEERDALIQKIDEERAIYHARIEALHADLRTRTEERDASLRDARKHAETRRLADDLQAELAATKVALAETNAEASRWANIARDTVLEVGRVRGQLESLASLTMKNGSAAVALAEIILAESKP